MNKLTKWILYVVGTNFALCFLCFTVVLAAWVVQKYPVVFWGIVVEILSLIVGTLLFACSEVEKW